LQIFWREKLTAFAPNTTGIPYEKNGHSKSMEIIKQLYDIGNFRALQNGISQIRAFIFSETYQIEKIEPAGIFLLI
jgi:hypothetical protein